MGRAVRGWIGLMCVLMGLVPSSVYAQAFRYQPQSGSAAGQANAFSAQADDPSALHYNPAGMTQLSGFQYYGNVQWVGASINYRNAAGVSAHGDLGGTVAMPPPSQTYLTANLASTGIGFLRDVSVGIGLTTPYALKTRYGETNPFSTAVTSSAIPMLDIKPTVAYRFSDQLSVGLGADIYTFAGFVGDGHVEQKSVSAGTAGIPAGANVEVNGKGTAPGFNVSLLYSPLLNADGLPMANIGLVYRSQATMHLQGRLLVNGATVADTRTTLVLPQMFTVAMAIWPLRDRHREWKLEADVDVTGWKSVRNLDIQLSNGTTVPQPENWKTVPNLSAGTEYKWLQPAWLPHWTVAARAGYTYTMTQIDDRTWNPGIPSVTSHTLATGVGFLCSAGGRFLGLLNCGSGQPDQPWWAPKGIGLDLAFQYWLYENRTVQGNLNPTVDGTYHNRLYLGAVSLRVVF